MNNYMNLPFIAYTITINILIAFQSDCWRSLVKFVCVDAMSATPIDYFHVDNLTYDQFLLKTIHTQNTSVLDL